MASSQVTIRRACSRAQERDRVSPQGQANMAIVLHHLTPGRHRLERHLRFVDLGSRLVAERLDRPERFASSQAQGRAEGVGFGELYERCRRHAGASP
jgi:hypothetical protein